MQDNTSSSLANVYDIAKDFLIKQIPGENPERILAHYLSLPDQSQLPRSIEFLYLELLKSAQNAHMKAGVIGKSIGGVDKLASILCCFNPLKVIDKYRTDAGRVLSDIEYLLKPSREIRKTSKSIWPKYCETILSSARFFIQFDTGDDFYKWANHLYQDKRSKASLPLILEQEIFGIGYPLACDFLKDIGFVDYGKPDVHISEIFSKLGLCKQGASPYEIQKSIGLVAEAKGVSAYAVDKLFWLIGSGHFNQHTEIGTKGTSTNTKKIFLEYMNNRLVSL